MRWEMDGGVRVDVPGELAQQSYTRQDHRDAATGVTRRTRRLIVETVEIIRPGQKDPTGSYIEADQLVFADDLTEQLSRADTSRPSAHTIPDMKGQVG